MSRLRMLCVFALLLAMALPAMAGSDNDAITLHQQISRAYKAGEKKVRIAPGTYRLSAPSADARAYLYFSKMKDFEIDATDAVFIGVDRAAGMVFFDRCEGITWKGGTMRYDPVPFSQGTIEAIDPQAKTISVRVAQGYPDDIEDTRYYPEDRAKFLNVYDPANRLRKDGISDLYFTDARLLSPGLIRFSVKTRFPEALRTGDLASWRGGGHPDFLLYLCAGMKLIDLRIESGIGFCVHENDGEGGNFYRYTVTRGPAPEGAVETPLLACNADAFHSSNVRKGPTLEDCLFEHMSDDGVPIHGTYALVASGDEPVLAMLGKNFCRLGDRLRFYRQDGTPIGDAVAGEVTPLTSYQPPEGYEGRLRLFKERRIHFARVDQLPANAQAGWMVANLDALGSGFTVRRTTIRHTRARGLLIKAGHGLIEDCTIEHTTMPGIALWPEMSYWNESDYAHDVIIRRNTIRRVGLWNDAWNEMAGALSIGAEIGGKYVPSPEGHARIVIEGNRFEQNDGVNLLITSAHEVTVKDNVFSQPMQRPSTRGSRALDPQSLIWITDSRKVSLEGNTVDQPGPEMKTIVEASPSVTDSALDGITRVP